MVRKLPFTQEEFKDIYSKVPRLCVDLVIVAKKGFILTLRTANGYEGKWHIPGGTVYYREPINYHGLKPMVFCRQVWILASSTD